MIHRALQVHRPPGSPRVIERGGLPPRPRVTPQATAPNPELAEYLPSFETLPGYVASVAVPNPSTLSIPSGTSAWYVFDQYRIGEDVGELALMTAKFELLPCDVDGSGDTATYVAWGTTKGYGAAVVVDINLGLPYRLWTGQHAFVPGVEATGHGALGPRDKRRYAFRTTFPTGKYTDTTPAKGAFVRSAAPTIRRATAGDTVDFALVVRGSSITGLGGARTLLCGIDVELTAMLYDVWKPLRR